MFFGIILILIVGVIAYWHYMQGLFSAGISAILCIVATMVAVGYHEWVVATLLGGKMADYASAMALTVTFAAVYLVLRIVFDWLVPGNVHFPLLVERVGSGAMGLVAGVFTAGVLALAAQMMPFGPSVAGFERFAMEWEKKCAIGTGSYRSLASATYDQLKEDQPFVKNEGQEKLLLPVDEIVLNLANRVSGPGGSLYVEKPLQQYHPDYLQELFGQRLGIQSGSKRCAMDGKVEVVGVFAAAGFSEQFDGERGSGGGQPTGIRPERAGTDSQGMQTFKSAQLEPRQAQNGKVLLVVRAKLLRDMADADVDTVAFAPAGVRLCARFGESDEAGNPKYVNYFPIGTVEYVGGRTILYKSRVDDMLFVHGDGVADFVFEVPDKVAPKAGQQRKIVNSESGAVGAFFEFKRLAHVDLSGTVVNDLNSANAVQGREPVMVLRKQGLPAKKDSGAPAEQTYTPANFAPDLAGTWTGADGYSVDFMEGERFSDKAPDDKSAEGTWKVVRTDNNMMVVQRTIPGPPLQTEDINVTFDNENQIQYTSAVDGHAGTYQRKRR